MWMSMSRPAENAIWVSLKTEDQKHPCRTIKLGSLEIGCILISWGRFVKVLRATDMFWWLWTSFPDGLKWSLWGFRMLKLWQGLSSRHMWWGLEYPLLCTLIKGEILIVLWWNHFASWWTSPKQGQPHIGPALMDRWSDITPLSWIFYDASCEENNESGTNIFLFWAWTSDPWLTGAQDLHRICCSLDMRWIYLWTSSMDCLWFGSSLKLPRGIWRCCLLSSSKFMQRLGLTCGERRNIRKGCMMWLADGKPSMWVIWSTGRIPQWSWGRAENCVPYLQGPMWWHGCYPLTCLRCKDKRSPWCYIMIGCGCVRTGWYHFGWGGRGASSLSRKKETQEWRMLHRTKKVMSQQGQMKVSMRSSCRM